MSIELTPDLLKSLISEAIKAANGQEKEIPQQTQETTYQVKPPEEFDLKEPLLWQNWIRRFNMFRTATGLNLKSDEQQVNMLLYCMGEEADQLLTSLGISENDRKSYEDTVKHFDKYFKTKKNIFYQRTLFIQQNQKPGQKVDAYINDLYKMAEKCEWSCQDCNSRRYCEEMIMLKIVTGISDEKLSKSLQLQENLTLEKVIQSVRQAEAVEEQQETLKPPIEKESCENIDETKSCERNVVNRGGRSGFVRTNGNHFNKRCPFCGGHKPHNRSECPANGQECYRCGLRGHFGLVCKTKNSKEIREVETDSSDNQCFDLSVLSLAENSCNPTPEETKRVPAFYVKCKVNCGPEIRFKVDTGADVSCMGLTQAKLLGLKIEPTEVRLKGPDNTCLSVIGKSSVLLQKGNIFHKEDIFILESQSMPLLGRGGIVAFELIRQIEELNATNKWITRYPDVFKGLGSFDEPYVIKIKDEAKPYAVTCPRRIAVPLMTKVKLELDKMVQDNIITPITEPTEWCAPLVVVPKKNGTIRLCVDYTQLNKYVERERIVLPTVEESLSQIGQAKVFSKLDANSGFWQVNLEPNTAKLTTFISPYGRFYFNRLPFGICSAPEHFQKKMYEALEGLSGVVNVADDILVFGETENEHNERLDKVLNRLCSKGLTVNLGKCEFNQRKVTFLGHVIDSGNIYPDPEKLRAITEMPKPENRSDLRRFIGMVNYLMKFLPRLSEKLKPLTELLSEKNEWVWTASHSLCFKELKNEIVHPSSLTMYDPQFETRVSADASCFGIGGVIEQKVNNFWKPVQYVSRTLSDVERRYAQIEKEGLALTWVCERFSSYLMGKRFELVTDHKPLVQIFGEKAISDLTPRLQRFRMRLMHFDFSIRHEAGKNFVLADVLSRAPVESSYEKSKESADVLDEVEQFVESVISSLPCSDIRLEKIKETLKNDKQFTILRDCISSGDWSSLVNSDFFRERGNLVYMQGLILRGTQLYIPKVMRNEILEQIHHGHFGVNKCLARARQTVWWPGISVDIKRIVENCSKCLENRKHTSEPLCVTELPGRPWEVVAADLLEYNKKMYLCVQDYFSKYIELISMKRTTTNDIKRAYLAIFSRHGVPNIVRCDNGTQLVSKEMQIVAKEIGFNIITSSPRFPQSNGQAESAVQICKNILKKNEDPYIGLLVHRSTPLECGLSPAELLFGRKIRSTLPVLPKLLTPKWPNLQNYRNQQNQIKQRNKFYFDRRHNARELDILKSGARVFVKDLKKYGTVVGHGETRRDYVIDVDSKKFRRNRVYLVPVRQSVMDYAFHQTEEKEDRNHERNSPIRSPEAEPQQRTNNGYVTRYGRRVNVPNHLKDFVHCYKREERV